MTRRILGKAAVLGVAGRWGLPAFAQAVPPESHEVTSYVADFIVKTGLADLPGEVVELAKKSILDGLGLALCGSAAKSGEIVRNYLKSESLFSSGSHAATVIGSPMKAPARFAAFANAIGIHADDYDDTQLAVAEDRVYGLLTHPTAPVLPAALAAAEIRSMPEKNCCLPTMSALKRNARSPRPSTPGITKTDFTRRAPPVLWAPRHPPRRFVDSIARWSQQRWESPPVKRPACARISAL